MSTNTPRTDAAIIPHRIEKEVEANFARALERELSEAKEQIEIAKSNGIAVTRMWQREAEQGESRRLRIEEMEKQNSELLALSERMGKILNHLLNGFLVGVSIRMEAAKTLAKLDAIKEKK